MSVLNLFPARVRFVNPDGTLTPVALRMLEVLVARVGGKLGDSGADVFADLDSSAGEIGLDVIAPQAVTEDSVAEQVVASTCCHCRAQIDIVNQPEAAPVDAALDFDLPSPITAEQIAGLGSMAEQNSDDIKVSGGSIDGVRIGATTPRAARVTTLQTDELYTVAKGAKFSGPATLAAALVATYSYEHPYTRYYIGDGTGYSFRFSRRSGGVTTDLATITDQGAAAFLGGFGCNGISAQPAFSVGGVATDLPTVITLANNMRSALINNGIAKN